MLAAGHPAEAQETTAQKFGARDDVRQVSLSPDGNRVAMLRATKGASTALFVAELTPGAAPKPILASSGRPDQIDECSWSTSTRLVCTISTLMMQNGRRLGFSRVVTLNADGSGLKELSGETRDAIGGAAQFGGDVLDLLADGDQGGAVLMTRNFGTQQSTGTLLAARLGGLGVERIDTSTLRRQQIEKPNPDASEYISDGHGEVRVMGVTPTSNEGMLKSRTSYLYRKAGQRGWEPLSTLTYNGGLSSGFNPYAVDRTLNAVYGFDSYNGRNALYRIFLDGSMKRELVLDNSEVDVDALIRVGRQRRVVGASFATDKRKAVFFDPELKALAAALARALPNEATVEFVDASADEQRLVLFTGSDVDPGRFYLFDRSNKKLTEILPARPQLSGIALAPVRAITFKASDGTAIPGYLTLPPGSDGKNIPAIVMPHGGPEARDEWGFDWLSQFFANRGFAVLQPNFRGSSGYGAAWFQKNGFQSWRTAVGDVNDAGRYLLSNGIAAPGKIAIFGWSYGGYAALQSAVLDPSLFKAIVAIAPVTDLETLRTERAAYVTYAIEDARIGHGSHVREGSPAQNADRIKVPVLLIHGDQDQNVGVGESRLMASQLRAAGGTVEYTEYKGLTHQLDDSDVRAEFLDKSEKFIKSAFGLKK
jgi:dipeptidyl aminopeptidase/acylaminoacyl peptidase